MRVGVAAGEGPDDDAVQTQFVQEADAGVVGARVDDEHPVDPVLGPPAAVDGALGRHVLHHLEEQAELALGQDLLDAGDQLQEERVHAQVGRRSRHHEPHGGRPLARQRTGRRARAPAQLLGHAPDTVAGEFRDARPVVEREGDGALRDPRPLGDVLHRRPARGCASDRRSVPGRRPLRCHPVPLSLRSLCCSSDVGFARPRGHRRRFRIIGRVMCRGN